MTKAPTQTEMSKGQSENTKNATKKFDWNEISPNFDRSSEYDLKNFPNVFRSL